MLDVRLDVWWGIGVRDLVETSLESHCLVLGLKVSKLLSVELLGVVLLSKLVDLARHHPGLVRGHSHVIVCLSEVVDLHRRRWE